MQERAKAGGDGKTKAERKAEKQADKLAAMSEEQRQELEEWLQWRKDLKLRIKESKEAKKAAQAKRKANEAETKAFGKRRMLLS